MLNYYYKFESIDKSVMIKGQLICLFFFNIKLSCKIIVKEKIIQVKQNDENKVG